ncbi:hypothetical protein A2U01_0072964, partial [Trifolium medium]|nr:hypothetical protein [Trifolium medium]
NVEEGDLQWPAVEKDGRRVLHARGRTDLATARGSHAQREKWRMEARASEYGGGKTTVMLAGGLHGGMWWWTV